MNKLVTDGCTKSPDSLLGIKIKSCCDRHDNCYDLAKVSRLVCDKTLLKCIKHKINTFNRDITSIKWVDRLIKWNLITFIAPLYYRVTRLFGSKHYNQRGYNGL